MFFVMGIIISIICISSLLMIKNYVTIKKQTFGKAEIRSVDNKKVYGYIYIEKMNDRQNVKISGSLDFDKDVTKGLHGFHIHEYGDVRNCCNNLGDHFNPHNKKHGGPFIIDDNGNKIMNTERHVGDLGNIFVNDKGLAEINITDQLVKINGNDNVIGRCIVIREHADDLGLGNFDDSQSIGHSGKIVAYGIIGIASEK
jgi:Cu-Zn family superoxide dismutase